MTSGAFSGSATPTLDDPNDLPELEDLVGEALTRLETAMDALNELAAALEMNGEKAQD